ncbi:MAG: rRNA pseudouridine synthase [Rhodocyclaceae bacterium]|jgi:23S rRNA pseudouridine2604 synthase|nr:rRNA pseudouridine synthase [Rhodocyclaceae bacterium]
MTEEKKPTLRIAPRPDKAAPKPAGKTTERSQGRYDRARPQRHIPATTPTPEGDGKVRISKLMAERGLCSRREADSYIERGLVWVNGERVAELGTKVDPSADIRLDTLAQAQQDARVTIILHKPIGFVSGQAEDGYKPAVTLIKAETQQRKSGAQIFHPSNLRGLAPAGRLDIDSTGLLVLTQDGVIARKLIGEDSDVEKEYLVRVEGTLTNQGLRDLNHGLSLDGVKLRPARVNWINDDQLHFVLKEGRKRQIRRMCELVGLKVVGLKRVRIGNVKLGDLPLGQWRYLREDESF